MRVMQYCLHLDSTALRSDRPHINHSLLSLLFIFFFSFLCSCFFIILAKRLPKHGFLMAVCSPIQIVIITIVQSAYYKTAYQHQFFNMVKAPPPQTFCKKSHGFTLDLIDGKKISLVPPNPPALKF